MNKNLQDRRQNLVSLVRHVQAFALTGILILVNVASANAGTCHAKSVIGLGIAEQRGFHDAPAHAERHQGSKYRVSHEEIGNNYTYGNAGTGHAHHHSGGFHHAVRMPENALQKLPDSDRQDREIPVPLAGSPGTSQYIKQTWTPGAARNTIVVAWSQDSFLQVDTSELTPGHRLVSRASITGPAGLIGTIEISAQLDPAGKPQINTQATGVFKSLKFDLVTHERNVVTLQFREPPTWTRPGRTPTFDIALDASIEDQRTRGHGRV